MNILVNRLNKKHFKLLLKGTSDLYQTKQFLESYFDELRDGNIISKDEMNYLLSNNIIFTEKTLNFKQIRYLYNACDLYISPYIAEGFNLCALEALTCGTNVLVPETGSTKEYMLDIYNNGGENNIHYVKSNVFTMDDGLNINNIDDNANFFSQDTWIFSSPMKYKINNPKCIGNFFCDSIMNYFLSKSKYQCYNLVYDINCYHIQENTSYSEYINSNVELLKEEWRKNFAIFKVTDFAYGLNFTTIDDYYTYKNENLFISFDEWAKSVVVPLIEE